MRSAFPITWPISAFQIFLGITADNVATVWSMTNIMYVIVFWILSQKIVFPLCVRWRANTFWKPLPWKVPSICCLKWYLQQFIVTPRKHHNIHFIGPELLVSQRFFKKKKKSHVTTTSEWHNQHGGHFLCTYGRNRKCAVKSEKYQLLVPNWHLLNHVRFSHLLSP